jgi:methylmalonyl-CoA mutase, N-terminal domain
MGGAAAAIERGFFQEAIARSAWELQRAQERGETTVVGVNRFSDDAPAPPIKAPDFRELEARQRERLSAVKARRDGALVEAALKAVRAVAGATTPLVPPILDAVRARATLGEISDVLRQAWGTYHPP